MSCDTPSLIFLMIHMYFKLRNTVRREKSKALEKASVIFLGFYKNKMAAAKGFLVDILEKKGNKSTN